MTDQQAVEAANEKKTMREKCSICGDDLPPLNGVEENDFCDICEDCKIQKEERKEFHGTDKCYDDCNFCSSRRYCIYSDYNED